MDIETEDSNPELTFVFVTPVESWTVKSIFRVYLFSKNIKALRTTDKSWLAIVRSQHRNPIIVNKVSKNYQSLLILKSFLEVLHLNYYLSYDVCACFRPSVCLIFCKKKFFVQNASNSQIRWTDISNSRIQARRAWRLSFIKW